MRGVAAELEVVVAGDDVDVIGELEARLLPDDGREQLAPEEGRADDIDGDRIVVLREKFGVACSEVEAPFVDHAVGQGGCH